MMLLTTRIRGWLAMMLLTTRIRGWLAMMLLSGVIINMRDYLGRNYPSCNQNKLKIYV